MAALSLLVICANDAALPATIAGANNAATNNQRDDRGEAMLRIDLEFDGG
jgi:hypothetical protein